MIKRDEQCALIMAIKQTRKNTLEKSKQKLLAKKINNNEQSRFC